MAYIASDHIIVAPAVRRSTTKPEARLLSEKSLVSIINRLIDRDGFVITREYSGNDPFEFNIFGYYFNIDQGGLLPQAVDASALEIYGVISIDEGVHFDELEGQDDTGTQTYTGLNVVSTEPNTGKYLKLLSRSTTADPWTVPLASMIKFQKESLEVSVDGGLIE